MAPESVVLVVAPKFVVLAEAAAVVVEAAAGFTDYCRNILVVQVKNCTKGKTA